MLKDIIRIFPADSWKCLQRYLMRAVDNFFERLVKRISSSRFPAIFVVDIPLETVPERVISPDLASGGVSPTLAQPKKPIMPMSVFNTDSVTIVRKKGDWFISASVKPKALSTFFYQISFAIPIKMLSFVTETAAVQAQEQRAKDAKSFRRLNASDLK